MIVYPYRSRTNDSDLVDLGPPENLGGKVLAGSPKISARVDFQNGNMLGGIFEATTGTVEVTFPFTEHATILEGEVTLTDEAGESYTYRPGDTYLIKQGQVIIWDVQVDRVRKSFFNITER
jgi:uncharacterized cupin superfamily protein